MYLDQKDAGIDMFGNSGHGRGWGIGVFVLTSRVSGI